MKEITRADLIRAAMAADELKMRQRRASHSGPGGLMNFVRDFWSILEPNIPLVEGWCLDAMCAHLEAVHTGEIKRLLINVSPGSMKSLLVNCFFPAWEWRVRPDLRYVSFSYSAHLTERDNERFRDIVRSRLYQRMYGDVVALTSEGKIKVANNKTGWKFASSVGGVGTGERGDRILLDDPHNVKEAESEVVRSDTVRWFREAMQNRLNDLAGGVIVVIMQRVNEYDVSGCIIESYPDYIHLCIPMEYDGRDIIEGEKYETCIGWSDPREVDGELAWPERYPAEVLEPFRSLAYLWAGQYQQSPEPRGGGILKRDYWRIWDHVAMARNDIRIGSFPPFEYVVASFDGAHTAKEENDYSALTVWGIWIEEDEEFKQYKNVYGAEEQLLGNPQVMLVDAWHKRLTLHGMDEPPQMRGEDKNEYEIRRKVNWGVVEWIIWTCRKHKVDKLLIENKAIGHSVEQEIRRMVRNEEWSTQLVDPRRLDKVARAYAIQHIFADGIVWRPDVNWAQAVEDELASFPRGAHDDWVDSSTQALSWLYKSGFSPKRHESKAVLEERLWPTKPRVRLHYEM